VQDEYDFSNAKRSAVVPLPTHQTEVRIRLDSEVLDWFRERAKEASGGNYQDIINTVLRTYANMREAVALTEATTDDKSTFG